MSRASRHAFPIPLHLGIRFFLRSKRGSNSVEFAILAPILCLLLLGSAYVGL
ncbi:TadE/TadG family type IV pilus assembly protein [Aureimonas sp. N4]|uniref:TadE/TadG family type IV pilus assembly protein n=1 Tax=Aureimonas sp. N4 TaxID=1638165 RepID=UPI000B0FFEAB|nr:TadE/TadG family type IV pilus assembly protein [Aureimonas sp. N4]